MSDAPDVVARAGARIRFLALYGIYGFGKIFTDAIAGIGGSD